MKFASSTVLAALLLAQPTSVMACAGISDCGPGTRRLAEDASMVDYLLHHARKLYSSSDRNLVEEGNVVEERMTTAKVLYTHSSRELSSDGGDAETPPLTHHAKEHLSKTCGDALYEIVAVYTQGPHFFVGGTPKDVEHMECPILAFNSDGNVYTAEKIEVLENEALFPTHIVGAIDLNHVMETYELVEPATEENHNIDTNSCECLRTCRSVENPCPLLAHFFILAHQAFIGL